MLLRALPCMDAPRAFVRVRLRASEVRVHRTRGSGLGSAYTVSYPPARPKRREPSHSLAVLFVGIRRDKRALSLSNRWNSAVRNCSASALSSKSFPPAAPTDCHQCSGLAIAAAHSDVQSGASEFTCASERGERGECRADGTCSALRCAALLGQCADACRAPAASGGR
jgi:hypothetical protein